MKTLKIILLTVTLSLPAHAYAMAPKRLLAEVNDPNQSAESACKTFDDCLGFEWQSHCGGDGIDPSDRWGDTQFKTTPILKGFTSVNKREERYGRFKIYFYLFNLLFFGQLFAA